MSQSIYIFILINTVCYLFASALHDFHGGGGLNAKYDNFFFLQ